MKTEDIVRIAAKLDCLVLESRMRDISLIAQTDRTQRVGTIAAVMSELAPGGYLLGAGPYCCGILPLTVDEVVLGRPPSPLESLPEKVADFTLNDAIYMVPREASRIHAAIVRRRRNGTTDYWLRDESSKTGTYLNGRRINDGAENSYADNPVRLTSGDIVSLGSSGVNSYIFVVIPPGETEPL